jgi:hypothetical protein
VVDRSVARLRGLTVNVGRFPGGLRSRLYAVARLRWHGTQRGISILLQLEEISVSGAIVFIRFVSGEIDEDSHLSAGLFRAVSSLLDEVVLPDYEYLALMDPLSWFELHLKVPFDYRLEPASLAEQALCWFRPTAHEHLSHAWEVVAILEERAIFMRTVKCHKPGYVLYEDEAQVLAYPFADLRRLL